MPESDGRNGQFLLHGAAVGILLLSILMAVAVGVCEYIGLDKGKSGGWRLVKNIAPPRLTTVYAEANWRGLLIQHGNWYYSVFAATSVEQELLSAKSFCGGGLRYFHSRSWINNRSMIADDVHSLYISLWLIYLFCTVTAITSLCKRSVRRLVKKWCWFVFLIGWLPSAYTSGKPRGFEVK